ncbi:hypothetical protein KR009_005573 [Drosophila setifemur]|nr:hypothetical protein KR009_005573 [Drosophila setifemur]
MRTYLFHMRPVLFLFYFVEMFLNLILMNYHLESMNVELLNEDSIDKELTQYFYLLSFYTFSVLTMFASVNICTGNPTSILEEVVRPLIGFVVYTVCSLMLLAEAEHGFYIVYSDHTDDIRFPEKPLHMFLSYARIQATTTLVCSVVFLLHALIALDVLLSNEDSDSEMESSSDNDNEFVAQVDYVPVRLYVLGGVFQSWLVRYQWFRDFISISRNI